MGVDVLSGRSGFVVFAHLLKSKMFSNSNLPSSSIYGTVFVINHNLESLNVGRGRIPSLLLTMSIKTKMMWSGDRMGRRIVSLFLSRKLLQEENSLSQKKLSHRKNSLSQKKFTLIERKLTFTKKLTFTEKTLIERNTGKERRG